MWWTRRVRGRATTLARQSAEPTRPLAREEIRLQLERRGVEPEYGRLLSCRLESRLDGLDQTASGALLDGVAVAFELQRETNQQISRSLKGLKEVERMMGAFSGELSKLDEVLEVLAAYVRRMRRSGASDEGRVLH